MFDLIKSLHQKPLIEEFMSTSFAIDKLKTMILTFVSSSTALGSQHSSFSYISCLTELSNHSWELMILLSLRHWEYTIPE